MSGTDVDKRTLIGQVIRAVQSVRRPRKGESREEWHAEMAGQLEEARDLLGAYGEGKALSHLVVLCTEMLEWVDLSHVGLTPTSEPPWKVLLADLLDPDAWGDAQRRARVLKMLRKLSHKLAHLAAAETAGDVVSIIDFCEARGVTPDALRGRLRRQNERAANRIEPVGFGENHRLLYPRDQLVELLTDEERARCP